MIEINLKIETIRVLGKSVKTTFKVITGKPIFDIHPDAAKHLGTTRKKYRKLMNN